MQAPHLGQLAQVAQFLKDLNMDPPYCWFAAWEANHDINSSRCPECLPKHKQNREGFKKLLYAMIPDCNHGTNYTLNGLLLSDEKCAQAVFGDDIKDQISRNQDPYNLGNTGHGNTGTIQIKTRQGLKPLNVTCVDPSKPEHVYKCFTNDVPRAQQPGAQPGAPQDFLSIKTQDVLVNGYVIYDVFLFIDTGQQILKYLAKSNISNKPSAGNNTQLNVHYMTSCLSLADSATQTTPEGKQFIGNANSAPDLRCYFYSWYNSEERQVGPATTNSQIYSTNYTVTTRPFPAPKPYKMQQIWQGGFNLNLDQIQYRVDVQDTNKSFSVPAIARSDLKTKLDIAINALENNDSTKLEIVNDVARSLAGKRSGDHLQIKDVLDFITHFDITKWFLVRGYLGGPHNVSWNTGQKNFNDFQYLANINNQQWRRNRSFFVTIDWPALAWALYNEINVIFLYLGAGGVKKLIRFIFN